MMERLGGIIGARVNFSENMAGGRGSMYEWAGQLSAPQRTFTHPLSAELSRPKYLIYSAIRALGLPTRNFISATLHQMKIDPERFLSRLQSPRIYMLLEEMTENGARLAAGNLSHDDVAEALMMPLPPDCFMATLIEETPSLLNGAVIVNGDGSLYGDFRTPEDGSVTRAGRPPSLRISADCYTRTLRYSFRGRRLRSMVSSLMAIIPFLEEERRFMPGYYELALLAGTGGAPEWSRPRPVMTDFRGGAIWSLRQPTPGAPATHKWRYEGVDGREAEGVATCDLRETRYGEREAWGVRACRNAYAGYR